VSLKTPAIISQHINSRTGVYQICPKYKIAYTCLQNKEKEQRCATIDLVLVV